MKIVINVLTVKKDAGGAFQVAYNFLLRTFKGDESDVDFYYFVSKDLDDSFERAFDDLKGITYFVFPTQPDFKGTYFQVKKEISALENSINPDLIYTIASPSYFSFKTREVMRFTNPWITHPNEYCWKTLKPIRRIRNRFFIILQSWLIKKASYFITQTQSAKEGIIRITGVESEHVCVVPNVLPQIFSNTRVCKQLDTNYIDIAAIAAPRLHKNIDIIPDVILKIRELSNTVKPRFHVTIPEDSELWQTIKAKIKKHKLDDYIINHGRVKQNALIDIYNTCSMSFMPTLLEVFSVTAVESMFFDLLIVASDFSFNKDILGDSALYYKPMDSLDAAKKILEMIENKDLQNYCHSEMQKRLCLYNDYEKHYYQTVNFLKKVASTPT